MKSEPGTYALILRSHSKAKVQIGRWRQINLEEGYYIYVGSAFGPGGVKARVSRHCRKTKPHHWHIDYLREFLSPLGAWYSHKWVSPSSKYRCCAGNKGTVGCRINANGLHGEAEKEQSPCI